MDDETVGRVRDRRRGWRHRLTVATLLLAGAVLTGWPAVQTVLGDRLGAADVVAYRERVAAVPSPTLTAQLKRARRYNTALPVRSLHDPWTSTDPRSDVAHAQYGEELGAAQVMARLRIPSIGVDLPVRHDATPSSLAHGVGHMYGSSLPVGGVGTHSVLAGHSDYRGRTFFDRLPELTAEDTFVVDVAGQELTYRVDRRTVVEPWQMEDVERIPGRDHVTLVTCYTPPGGHRQRLLVRGVRSVTVPPVTAGASPTTARSAPSLTPALRLRLATSAAAMALLVILGGWWRISDRRDSRSAPAPSPAPVQTWSENRAARGGDRNRDCLEMP